MKKRTIKPAAGNSRISPAEAKAAARKVYRDESGRFVIVDPSGKVIKRVGPRRASKLNNLRNGSVRG